MNRLKKELFEIKVLVAFVSFLFIVLFAFLVMNGYSNLNNHIDETHKELFDTIDQRVKFIILEINDFPKSAGNEILFLSKLSCIAGVSRLADGGAKEIAMKDSQNDFLTFLRENNAYYQLIYVDKNGKEIVKATANPDNTYSLASGDELRDISSEYLFKKTIALSDKEIFVSPLMLNTDNGKVENVGTLNNPKYVPVIKYATHIFDDDGNSLGMIILSVDANYFLEDIRRSQRDGEKVFLVNNDGYYLANYEEEKEFSFMFSDRDYSIYKDYPFLSPDVLKDSDNRRFEIDGVIFTFRNIYPTATSFEVHEGSQQVFGDNPEQEYYWILVSVSDRNILNSATDGFRENYRFSLLFSGLIIMLIMLLLLFIWRTK